MIVRSPVRGEVCMRVCTMAWNRVEAWRESASNATPRHYERSACLLDCLLAAHTHSRTRRLISPPNHLSIHPPIIQTPYIAVMKFITTSRHVTSRHAASHSASRRGLTARRTGRARRRDACRRRRPPCLRRHERGRSRVWDRRPRG